jgi:hypothetical protein
MDQLKVKVLLWDLRMEGSPWPQQEPRLRQLRAAYLLHKRTLIMARFLKAALSSQAVCTVASTLRLD